MPSAAFPRRHYRDVTLAATESGFAVALDGRAPRSPAGRPLVLPTEALGRRVADEWAAQGEQVVLPTMPTTRLAHVALDAAPAAHADLAARLAEFAAHDLFCYFADAPAALTARQEAAWRPLLAWAQDRLGLTFVTGVGVAHVEQPPATLAAVERAAAVENDFVLAGLIAAAQLFGSAILALALRHGRLDGAEAFALSQIDETFQAEFWGDDAEAAERRAAMAADAVALEAWFRALS